MSIKSYKPKATTFTLFCQLKFQNITVYTHSIQSTFTYVYSSRLSYYYISVISIQLLTAQTACFTTWLDNSLIFSLE